MLIQVLQAMIQFPWWTSDFLVGMCGDAMVRPQRKATIHLPGTACASPMASPKAARTISLAMPSRTTFFWTRQMASASARRSEEHTSELQSRENLVCRLLLEEKKL